MKKFKILLLLCCILFSVCGCGKVKEIEPTLKEIKNSDYTYSYKNSKGKIIFSHLSYQLFFKDGLSVYEKDGKYGVVNTNGDTVIEPMYNWVAGYNDGMCACFYESNEKTYLVYYDDKKRFAIEPMRCDVTLNSSNGYDCSFYNGIALYRNPDTHKYGYIDKKGKLIIPAIYDWAEPFISDITVVFINNKWKFIDKTGKVSLQFKCQQMQPFSDGLAAVMVDYKWGYINKSGNWVIKPQYGSFEDGDGEYIAYNFYKGYTGVYLGVGQASSIENYPQCFALIDKTGKILDGKKYDNLYQTQNEKGEMIYHVVKNGEMYWINYCGKRINL